MLVQTVSVVVPVYLAGAALHSTVEELLKSADRFDVASTVKLELDEVVLVVDNPRLSPTERADVRALEDLDRRVHSMWLTRNFGQHPATVAGIVSTNGDWVVTMDEDGQHDPEQIPRMLLTAAERTAPLVYAKPTNPPPHGAARNLASRVAKAIFRWLSGAEEDFHSFRLMEGSIARSACAYIGESVYLDVAMRWSCGDPAICPMKMRTESARSSYRTRQLLSHFWRMVLSTGTRPLRLIAIAGVVVAFVGLVVAAIVAERRLSGAFPTPGWTSVMVALLILSGGLFISLAVVAEYVGFAVRNSIGKPLYVKAEHFDARALWGLQGGVAQFRVNTAHVLFGGSGILGSGYSAMLARLGADVIRLTPRWGETGHSASALDAALLPLTSRRVSVTVIWAAGVGHTGAGEDAMRAESAAVQSLCDVITHLPAAARARVSVLFASSAGALYGGHGYSEISETDQPCPVTSYGREKLAQEEVLHAFAAETGCRVVLCRYSNLYGLAGGRLTARGLVSTAVRATRLRQPMVVYVSPDTRRDLVFNVDAAAESLHLLEEATTGVTTAFVRDGETRTVSEILALVGRVSGRRVPATYAERPETRLQPKVLRFRRPVRDPRSVRRTPLEVAVHLMLRAPMAR